MLLCEKYRYAPDEEVIARSINVIAANLDAINTPEVLKKCFSIMDLTTLDAADTPTSVRAFVEKANAIRTSLPGYPFPASVCVYPNFAAIVKESRCCPEIHVTTVAGCFPSSQSYLEVKLRECELAVENGADEVDIVLALNSFLDGDMDAARHELRMIKAAIDKAAAAQGRKVILKTIIETGLLVTPEKIAEASFLAMEEGADFIKTSTGKVKVNATPVAAYVMCEAIKAYNAATGRKVGFKAAGGIATANDALCYYSIVSSILGKEWLDKSLFRFGVSRLGNALVSAIEQKNVNFF